MKISGVIGSMSGWAVMVCGVWVLGVSGEAADVPASKPQVVISEFLTENKSGLTDDAGEKSDWIEIFNRSKAKVNLEGWVLTDDAKDLKKWQFPAVALEPGAYLVVFASGKNQRDPAGRLHTNFKLENKGEYLGLFDASGAVVHQYAPKYPKQKADVSYGVVRGMEEKGLMEVGFCESPTPGIANRGAVAEKIKGVQFVPSRGFYDRPFELVLRSALEGATIRYTLDGSEPTEIRGKVYAGPVAITGTRIVRAAAFRKGDDRVDVETHTYLFSSDIVRQSPDGLPPEGFHYRWGGNKVDYGMDPRVVDHPRYRDEILDGLKAIPSFSLVMDLDDLFDARKGIYANAQMDGREAERRSSLELIQSEGSGGFQIDCGARIRGGFSRMPNNSKHGFRFFFRKEYGAGKLEYPLFGMAAAQSFDHFDLRTSQNYSWSLGGDPNAVFLRDQFNRDVQLAMGHPAARGDFYHLYVNGQYWGLYNTCERPEASFGESYLGGNKEEYDVVKTTGFRGSPDGAPFLTDGNVEAWKVLYDMARAGLESDAAYQKLLGNNPDGTRNLEYPVLLDPVNLIDYMLVIFYGGNMDAPISKFAGNNGPNNWYGMRNRNGTHGFQFFVWDAEHTLLDLEEDRTGPFPAGERFEHSNPQWLWQRCLMNAEFRLLTADRIYRHFFNDGVLTPRSASARFMARVREIEQAVICESARWGDVERFRMGGGPPGPEADGPLMRDEHWRPAVERIVKDYFPKRTAVVVDQLWLMGLWSELMPPEVEPRGGILAAGGTIRLRGATGAIYYTLDGSDPRKLGGSVARTAQRYNEPIVVDKPTVLKARVRTGEEWSPLTEVAFGMVRTAAVGRD